MNTKAISVVAALTLALSSVACTIQAPDAAGGQKSAGGTGSGSDGSQDTGGSGGCDDTCKYYLQCNGADTSLQGQCVQECQGQGWTSDQLAQMQQMSCTELNDWLRPKPQPQPKGADCFGCQHDGSSCIYIGPMGGHTQCDASCC